MHMHVTNTYVVYVYMYCICRLQIHIVCMTTHISAVIEAASAPRSIGGMVPCLHGEIHILWLAHQAES